MYATEWAMSINNTCEQYNEQNANKSVQKEANIEKYNKKADSSQERGTVDTHGKKASLQEDKVNRTRSGHTVRKPDRLTCI